MGIDFIEVNDAKDKAGVELALHHAKARWGSKLILTGPTAFHAGAIRVATDEGIKVKFIDEKSKTVVRRLRKAAAEQGAQVVPQPAPMTERAQILGRTALQVVNVLRPDNRESVLDALLSAKRRFGDKLRLAGDAAFRALAIKTQLESGLEIEWRDKSSACVAQVVRRALEHAGLLKPVATTRQVKASLEGHQPRLSDSCAILRLRTVHLH